MKRLRNDRNYAMRVDWVQSKGCFGNYGVFASRSLHRGEIIEECPTALRDYYDVDEDHFSYVIHDHDQVYIVTAFGLGSLYNHRNIPNAHWYFDVPRRLLLIYAIRDIARDEEICINYRIEDNLRMDQFDLGSALRNVPLEEYRKLTFEVDTTDILEFLGGAPARRDPKTAPRPVPRARAVQTTQSIPPTPAG